MYYLSTTRAHSNLHSPHHGPAQIVPSLFNHRYKSYHNNCAHTGDPRLTAHWDHNLGRAMSPLAGPLSVRTLPPPPLLSPRGRSQEKYTKSLLDLHPSPLTAWGNGGSRSSAAWTQPSSRSTASLPSHGLSRQPYQASCKKCHGRG